MKVVNTMEVIELSKNLDMVAAHALLEVLLEKRGHDVVIDAQNVQRLGAQCLQILLAAKKAWEADECHFSPESPSEAFTDSIKLMGVSVEDLTYNKQDGHREK